MTQVSRLLPTALLKRLLSEKLLHLRLQGLFGLFAVLRIECRFSAGVSRAIAGLSPALSPTRRIVSVDSWTASYVTSLCADLEPAMGQC